MKNLGFVALLILAACGASWTEQGPRSAMAETRLSRALSDKVAGAPQRCISRFGRNEQEIVDRNTILFKNGRDLTYRNDPQGGCAGLDPSRSIVTTSIAGDLCEGDTIRVVDQTSGRVVGFCAFSEFIPYSRRGAADPGGS